MLLTSQHLLVGNHPILLEDVTGLILNDWSGASLSPRQIRMVDHYNCPQDCGAFCIQIVENEIEQKAHLTPKIFNPKNIYLHFMMESSYMDEGGWYQKTSWTAGVLEGENVIVE